MKIMKRYIPVILIIGSLFTWSCSEGFLERYPLDELAPQDFFNSPEELQIYANRFYVLLPAHQGYFNTFYVDANSDNLVPAEFDMRLAGTRTVPSSVSATTVNTRFSIVYGWNWADIRQANYFLEHCNKATGTPEDLKQYIGEVRFFRAFLYFDKVKTFGDVPWISKTTNTTSPELYIPRTSRKVVTDSIIADLDIAISYLKPAAQANAFRINKEVAMLLKARVCLYEGTWEKYHSGTPLGVSGSDGSQFIQKAAEVADQLMQTNAHSIYKGPAGREYWSLFNQLDYTGNPEVMLWKKYDIGLQITHNVARYMAGGIGQIGMSKGLIDSYLCTDGKPISISPLFLGYDSLLMEATNRDPRLQQSVFLPGDDQRINGPGGTLNVKFEKPTLDGMGEFRNTTGFAIYKGVNPDYSQSSNDNVGTQGSIIFRYAEALLIYAEAKAEMGNITQADVDRTINRLRDRVGMIHLDINNISTDPNWDYPTLSPVINEIRRERRVELSCEGSRWDDLARWRAHHLIVGKRLKGAKYTGTNLDGAYKDAQGNPSIVIGVNLYVDANGFIDPYQNVFPNGFGFDPNRDYLSPIPSDEITLNDKLVQNPGWE